MAKDFQFRAKFKTDQQNALFGVAYSSPEQGLGYTQTYLKSNTSASQYCIASEYIGGKIGQFLGLPIPPFGILFGDDRRPYFASFDFNYVRETYPEVLPDKCVASLPTLCAGILVFDILVANKDRHAGNLVVNKLSEPTQMIVFDHDQAIFGGAFLRGNKKLDRFRDDLSITGSIQGRRHVFLDELHDSALLDPWVKKISFIPDWFINEVCEFVASEKVGITLEEARDAASFLTRRKCRIDKLIEENKAEFTSITKWPEKGLI